MADELSDSCHELLGFFRDDVEEHRLLHTFVCSEEARGEWEQKQLEFGELVVGLDLPNP